MRDQTQRPERPDIRPEHGAQLVGDINKTLQIRAEHRRIELDCKAFQLGFTLVMTSLTVPGGSDHHDFYTLGSCLPERLRHRLNRNDKNHQVQLTGHIRDGTVHWQAQDLTAFGIDRIYPAAITSIDDCLEGLITPFLGMA